MDKKLKIASIMLYVVAGVAILFGFLYSFSPTLMPYHERALGMTHEQLQPEVAALFLTLMRVIGASFLSIGVALVLLVKGPFSKGDRWAWWIILFLGLICLVPLLFITLNVGLYSPWWVVAILIILEIVALILSWSPRSE
jgi:Na+-driven multidrug efflux pump